MGSKNGCAALRVQFRVASRACSSALLIGTLSVHPAAASPDQMALPSPLQALAETGAEAGAPLLTQAQGEALDFRARDVSGPAGRPIPLKIDLPAGADSDPTAGKLFIISGLPAGIVLSPGGNVGDFWAVNASVVKDLTLTAPPDFSGTFSLTITRSRGPADAARTATITVSIGQPDTTPTSAAAPTFPERTASPAAAPSGLPSAGGRSAPANEQMLMARADASFKKGDVSGARVIYEYLAMQGSALGAMAMGESYDPLVLSRMVVKGLTPDAAKARQWYEKAEQLGSGEARGRLNALASK